MEQALNSLKTELEAMAAVGQVLGELSDPAARQRVLKWAAERYAFESVTPGRVRALATLPFLASEPIADPALTIDSLDEMFAGSVAEVAVTSDVDDDLGEFAGPASLAATTPEAPRQPLDVMIRSFAQDFQRFVEEWNGATA